MQQKYKLIKINRESGRKIKVRFKDCPVIDQHKLHFLTSFLCYLSNRRLHCFPRAPFVLLSSCSVPFLLQMSSLIYFSLNKLIALK